MSVRSDAERQCVVYQYTIGVLVTATLQGYTILDRLNGKELMRYV